MDIDLLSKMVKELILDDDRVVLPGLGCFVAEIVPAYFSDKGYTINPPYRKLYFRSRPDEGDSLVSFYARSNGMDHEVAERIIRDFVAELKSVLHAKKVVVFPGLGRLRATKENNVFFIADEDLDIYPEGFGLEPVSLKTHKETVEEVSAAVADLKSILEPLPDPAPSPEPSPEPLPEPSSAPSPESALEPTPASDPAPSQSPAPEPASDPLSESVPDPSPAPAPESESIPVPEPEPEPESESIPSPVPDPIPAPEPEAEQILQPEPEPEPVHIPEEPLADNRETDVPPVAEPGRGIKPGRILLIILAVLILLTVAYMAVGRLCPEWIDRFLYTPEELEILNR